MSRPIRSLGVLLSLALLVPVGPLLTTTSAQAAPLACSASPSATDIGDIDGDRIADAVVTSFYGPNPFLEVHNTKAGAQQVNLEAALGMDGITHVVVADVTGDGCADAVGSYYDEEQNYKEGSFIIPGSNAGLVPSATKFFDSPGGSVAVIKSPRMIAVNNYSSVALFPLAADGTPGQPVIKGTFPTGSEAAGEIESMVADGNRLVIGTQSATVSRKLAAGVVTVWSFTGKGLEYKSLKLTQNSTGFTTAAEKGDYFGSALALRGDYLAIGVPYETIGTKKQTGMVHVVKLAAGTTPKVSKVYNLNQDSAGIPGKNETGDYWGHSVALAIGVGCTKVSLIAGAPTETVGTLQRAGAVTVAGIGSACADAWSPGKAPLGAVQALRVGDEVATLTDATTGKDIVLLQASGYGQAQVFAVKTTAPRTWSSTEVPPLGNASDRGGSNLGVPQHS